MIQWHAQTGELLASTLLQTSTAIFFSDSEKNPYREFSTSYTRSDSRTLFATHVGTRQWPSVQARLDARLPGTEILEYRDSDRIINEKMWQAIWRKFTQNPDLCRQLIQSKNAVLVYHNNDPIWGNGHNGHGENRLGLMLMYLRCRILHGEHLSVDPYPHLSIRVNRIEADVTLQLKPKIFIPLCPYKNQRTAIGYFNISRYRLRVSSTNDDVAMRKVRLQPS